MNSFVDVRHDVLDLHKTVLDAARREYERDHGRLRNTEFLSVLIEDPAFAWLNPLTALIVRIDEALEDEEQSPELEELASRLRALIAPGTGDPEFQRRYADILQREPDALVAHVRTMRALQR